VTYPVCMIYPAKKILFVLYRALSHFNKLIEQSLNLSIQKRNFHNEQFDYSSCWIRFPVKIIGHRQSRFWKAFLIFGGNKLSSRVDRNRAINHWNGWITQESFLSLFFWFWLLSFSQNSDQVTNLGNSMATCCSFQSSGHFLEFYKSLQEASNLSIFTESCPIAC